MNRQVPNSKAMPACLVSNSNGITWSGKFDVHVHIYIYYTIHTYVYSVNVDSFSFVNHVPLPLRPKGTSKLPLPPHPASPKDLFALSLAKRFLKVSKQTSSPTTPSSALAPKLRSGRLDVARSGTKHHKGCGNANLSSGIQPQLGKS